MNKKDRNHDSPIGTISKPYAVIHEIHIEASDMQHIDSVEYDKREIAPTPSNKDDTEDNLFQGQSKLILRIMKEEFAPGLLSEIGDIVEERVRKVFDEAEMHSCQIYPCSRLQGEHDESPSTTQRLRHGERLLRECDERECLADALQDHIKEIVDGVVFNDSELPDTLINDGCLTEDECAGVRKLDRKNQVRALVSIIKGRDFDVIKRFLKRVRSHNENLTKKIDVVFARNKSNGMRCLQCVYCKLMSQVNLKYIVDDLWRFRIIDDGLYNQIVGTDRPAGAQRGLWNDVMGSLNMTYEKRPSVVQDFLKQALGDKQHYSYLANGATWMISNYGGMRCDCDLTNNPMAQNKSLSLSSLSISPRSSLSDCAENTQIDRTSVMILNQKEFVSNPMRHQSRVPSLRMPDDVMPEQHGFHRTTPLFNINSTNRGYLQPTKSSLDRHNLVLTGEFGASADV